MHNAELIEGLKDELSRFPASKEIEVTFTQEELVYIVDLLSKALRPEGVERIEALEEAAKVCDEIHDSFPVASFSLQNVCSRATADECRKSIRLLKRCLPQKEQQ